MFTYRALTGLAVATAVVVLAAGAQAAKYKEIAVTNGGTISGKVLLGDAKPEVQTFTISKNPEVCGTGAREVEWVRTNGGGLLDAVVYLEKVAAGKPFPEQAKKIAIDQKGCRFTPFIQAMANGGEIEVLNSDGALHNIHTYELIKKARRTVFNVSQPNQGDRFVKKIKLRKGVAMKIECDAHDFMHGWIFVARNPYYALVDDNGEFTIGDVPPGKYVVKSWHGRLGEKKTTVEVKAGATAEANFSY
ncbi:MAG: hypothetical protein ACE5GS_08250 [Kiloniellaceae bacterium]